MQIDNIKQLQTVMTCIYYKYGSLTKESYYLRRHALRIYKIVC